MTAVSGPTVYEIGSLDVSNPVGLHGLLQELLYILLLLYNFVSSSVVPYYIT